MLGSLPLGGSTCTSEYRVQTTQEARGALHFVILGAVADCSRVPKNELRPDVLYFTMENGWVEGRLAVPGTSWLIPKTEWLIPENRGLIPKTTVVDTSRKLVDTKTRTVDTKNTMVDTKKKG